MEERARIARAYRDAMLAWRATEEARIDAEKAQIAKGIREVEYARLKAEAKEKAAQRKADEKIWKRVEARQLKQDLAAGHTPLICCELCFGDGSSNFVRTTEKIAVSEPHDEEEKRKRTLEAFGLDVRGLDVRGIGFDDTSPAATVASTAAAIAAATTTTTITTTPTAAAATAFVTASSDNATSPEDSFNSSTDAGGVAETESSVAISAADTPGGGGSSGGGGEAREEQTEDWLTEWLKRGDSEDSDEDYLMNDVWTQPSATNVRTTRIEEHVVAEAVVAGNAATESGDGDASGTAVGSEATGTGVDTNAASDDVRDGWTKVFDPNYQQYYYYHNESQTSAWEPPSAFRDPAAVTEQEQSYPISSASPLSSLSAAPDTSAGTAADDSGTTSDSTAAVGDGGSAYSSTEAHAAFEWLAKHHEEIKDVDPDEFDFEKLKTRIDKQIREETEKEKNAASSSSDSEDSDDDMGPWTGWFGPHWFHHMQKWFPQNKDDPRCTKVRPHMHTRALLS